LDDTTKTIAEFWADGPASTLPPGHWHHVCLEAIYRENLDLEQSIKLLFMQANAVFDAGIACWDTKRYYDSVRPITAIQCLFGNTTVKSWKGPYQGVGLISGALWQPYQNVYFVTPAFASYVSGHSTFSTASAYILRSFFGDDTYRGDSYTVPAGSSLFEPKITSGPDWIPGVTDVPNSGPETVGYTPATDIYLSWSTWTEAAEQAGVSRLMGGIHTDADNVDGLTMGTSVGKLVYQKAQDLFNGGSGPSCTCPQTTCPVVDPYVSGASNVLSFGSLVLSVVGIIAVYL